MKHSSPVIERDAIESVITDLVNDGKIPFLRVRDGRVIADAILAKLDLAQQQDRSALTKIAAECHRAKWEFDLSSDYRPTAKVARDMIPRAFKALHDIGDMALKLRDASKSVTSIDGAKS